MLRSYIRIGIRNISRERGFSLINISGLALGMAIFLMIALWINDELQYNKYFTNYDRIGRVVRNITVNDEILSRTYLPNTLGDELRSEYGDLFTRVSMAYPVEEYFLTVGDTKLPLRGEFLEPEGTELFDLQMLHGDVGNLTDIHSIFLAESVAKVLFGEENPVGRQLKINNCMDVIITGVYKDLPRNTHLHDAKFFAPLELLSSYELWMKEPSHTQNFLNVYVQIADNIEFESVSGRIRDLILNNVQDDVEYASMHPQIFLQPIEEWHLYSDWKNGKKTGTRARIVWLFGVIGSFVLFLACINFMNLSTARSERRSKEVGIRKSIGSKRRQLIEQFYSESFIIVLFSSVLSFVVTQSGLAWFNELSGKQIEIPFSSPYFWALVLAFIVGTAIMAGTYPAIYLSSFNPIQVLKGWRAGRSVLVPRKVLVVVQFVISTVLIIGTVIVYQQVQFAKDRPVGYTREGLIMIQMTSPDFNGKYDLLRDQLKNTGTVIDVAESSSPPTDVWSANSGLDWDGKDPDTEQVFGTLTVTPEYGSTVGWQFISGRDFSRDLAGDSAAFVINRAAAKEFGFKDPIGKEVRWKTWRSKFEGFTIIGVINDMLMGSPYESSRPAVYFLSGDTHHFINIKIDPTVSASEAITAIQSVFRKVIPSVPFDYKFVDQEYAQKFTSEERIGTLSSIFSVFAIFISCLGLLGLSAFMVEQRTKEIGIRKVLGAPVFHLWAKLSTEFLILVFFALMVSIPFTYYYMESWLQSYEYRTEISPGVILIICIGTVGVTLATVSFQSLRAALSNPVKSLRTQ